MGERITCPICGEDYDSGDDHCFDCAPPRRAKESKPKESTSKKKKTKT